jgi:hypothetical protein
METNAHYTVNDVARWSQNISAKIAPCPYEFFKRYDNKNVRTGTIHTIASNILFEVRKQVEKDPRNYSIDLDLSCITTTIYPCDLTTLAPFFQEEGLKLKWSDHLIHYVDQKWITNSAPGQLKVNITLPLIGQKVSLNEQFLKRYEEIRRKIFDEISVLSDDGIPEKTGLQLTATGIRMQAVSVLNETQRLANQVPTGDSVQVDGANLGFYANNVELLIPIFEKADVSVKRLEDRIAGGLTLRVSDMVIAYPVKVSYPVFEIKLIK